MLNELLDADVSEYIKRLGFEHLNWQTGAPSDGTDLVLLITKLGGEQLHLSIGKASGYDFVSPDDLSWTGPVKWVEAWAEISI